jgi:hypothetical protein
MKKNSILMFVFLAITAFSLQSISAQVTITIPKLPKIKKPKVDVQQTEQTPTTTATSGKTSGQDSSLPQKSGEDDTMDFRLSFFLDEIKKAQQSVDEYDPDTKLYLISSALSDWLWRAVSMQEREKWGKEWLKKPNEKQKFDQALDALAASAAKQLPNYRMNTKNYAVHNVAEEKMMKSVLKNPAIYKIHYTGLEQANWLIDKNELGIPTSRYKHGAIWLRNTTSDHPYCYITYVNIIQDYAGGGTYATSYPYFVRDEMVGCPTGN